MHFLSLSTIVSPPSSSICITSFCEWLYSLLSHHSRTLMPQSLHDPAWQLWMCLPLLIAFSFSLFSLLILVPSHISRCYPWYSLKEATSSSPLRPPPPFMNTTRLCFVLFSIHLISFFVLLQTHPKEERKMPPRISCYTHYKRLLIMNTLSSNTHSTLNTYQQFFNSPLLLCILISSGWLSNHISSPLSLHSLSHHSRIVTI